MPLFTFRSFDEIVEIMMDGFRRIPGLEIYQGSPAWLDARAWARATADNNQALAAIARNVTPLEADLEGLESWASVLELPRKSGTKASAPQSILIRASSPGGQVIPAGTLLQTNSIQYEVLNIAVIPGIAPFQVLVDITAQNAGSDGNLSAGDTLDFVTPIPGVKPTAQVAVDINNGSDLESEGDWRDRLMKAWRDKRGGGRRTDYEIWAGEVDWVHRVWVYKQKPSVNSVGVTAVKNSTAGALLPTTTEINQLLAYLTDPDRKPITDDVVWISIQLKRVHSETTVVLGSSYSADWTRPVGGLTVNSWNAGTQTITTNETLPTNLRAGDLVTLVTSDITQLLTATGRPARVSTVTGPTTFVVSPYAGTQVFDHVPQAGDEIYPSSAILAKSRLQILNGLGDDCGVLNFLVPMNDLGPANPIDKDYGTWISDLRESDVSTFARTPEISSAVTTIEGAVGGILAAVEFPFPTNTTVELLIPGQVWVHV